MTERETLKCLKEDVEKIEKTVTTEGSTQSVAMQLKKMIEQVRKDCTLLNEAQRLERRGQPTSYLTCLRVIDSELSPFVYAAELPHFERVVGKLEYVRKDIERRLVEDFTTQ